MKILKKEELLKIAAELCEGANQSVPENKRNCVPYNNVGWWKVNLMQSVRMNEEVKEIECKKSFSSLLRQ